MTVAWRAASTTGLLPCRVWTEAPGALHPRGAGAAFQAASRQCCPEGRRWLFPDGRDCLHQRPASWAQCRPTLTEILFFRQLDILCSKGRSLARTIHSNLWVGHEVEIQGETFAVILCGLFQSLGVTAHHGTLSSAVALKSSAPRGQGSAVPRPTCLISPGQGD